MKDNVELEVTGDKSIQITQLDVAPVPLMGLKPLRVSSLRDARRLAQRVLLCFQSGTIDSDSAKTLMYLVQCYINCCRMGDFEDRLLAVEKGVRV